MRQLRVSIAVLAVISFFVTIALYYWNDLTIPYLNKRNRLVETTTEKYVKTYAMKHIPLNKVYGAYKETNDTSSLLDEHRQVYMIDTPGCKIPIKLINYRKDLKQNKNQKKCGPRAVYLSRDDEFKIRVYIESGNMKKYLRKTSNYYCCYRYMLRNQLLGSSKYSDCKPIKHGSTFILEWDFINVKCYDYDEKNVSHTIYDDIYAFTKKVNVPKQDRKKCHLQYNVIMIGMDSMSLSRFSQTMSRTVKYFSENFWFAFRAYNKIDDNTFPNVMAAITGKNLSTIAELCSWKMDECKDLFLWNKFKEDGYVTAYGEDYLRLPDTFTNQYGFQEQPTDHYLRHFLINREFETNNKTLVCAGKVPSGQQLLNFAVDFVDTYKLEKFFGLFWLNSFSHNENSRPQDADRILEDFFNQISYTGALANTFVIFFSDHGVRFGKYRMKMESYFDDRLPFLFIWVPTYFTGRQIMKYRSLFINQFRLITPYDLFNTVMEIKSMSSCKNFTGVETDGPASQSIFDEVTKNRTCEAIGIHDKWCSCHNLYPLPVQDNEGERCVFHVLSEMNSMIRDIKTRHCWGCMKLTLRNITRINFYYSNDKVNVFYVVAFTVSPGNVSYEATLLRKGKKLEIVGPVSLISSYRGLGKCTMNPKDRLYCLCQKIEKCS